ncbi:LysE family translocator [Mangrovibrevibacter kandeliae]|uniref:LysE family translocator n=1 Tax=Mangrovibrevibacter kandeliae TaxID=2968473 RepID=UPI0021196846|nr:LysE family translocator [Aurantimonas sp. CSK15Z-1]MCQ8782277.1 LysE family translocator [Aurantimonas sp. CSK15Z-1]
MDLSALCMFAGALFVAAGSPGPSVAALVARVLSRGHRDVLPFLAAMWIGEAAWLAAALLGLSALAATFHVLFVVLKYLGVAYLLWLAFRMWTAPVGASRDEVVPRAGAPLRMFLAGLAITLGNPKIMLFYLALVPSLIDVTRITALGWAELTGVMLAVLMIIDLGWMAAAAKARRLLRSPRAMRLANRSSAALMAGAAGAIATR